MISDEQQTGSESLRPAVNLRAISKWIGAAVLALLGIILLVATKSTAGGALLVAAALVLLPVRRLNIGQRIAQWLRAGLVAVLVALAVYSVAGTDIVPDQAKTGVKFIDQVLAIFERFQDTVRGKSAPSKR